MTPKSDIRTEANRLRAHFEARGAEVFETDILQPAGALLGLYGEDIRARAFVTHDPLRGEMMLRPDFTVPLVQSHISAGRGTASYTYSGEVFRRQEDDEDRPTEFIQVGYEMFGGKEAEADATVFTAVSEALSGLPLNATISDFGVLRAAIASLNTPERRKTALLRHIWRPVRFKALLDRFSRPAPQPAGMPDPNMPHVGLRSREDIAARLELLAEEAATDPLSDTEVERIKSCLAVKSNAPDAVQSLRRIAASDDALNNAIDKVATRLEALEKLGINANSLTFQTSYGLTSLEYYSGFVFGFAAADATKYPVVASGGRYDLLTKAIGQGASLPAVGGVIRPDVVHKLRKGAV